jgi:hypothetical protein
MNFESIKYVGNLNLKLEIEDEDINESSKFHWLVTDSDPETDLANENDNHVCGDVAGNTLEEALANFQKYSESHPHIYSYGLICDSTYQIYLIIPPLREKPKEDEDYERREAQMQAAMAYGTQGWNDFEGYDEDEERERDYDGYYNRG